MLSVSLDIDIETAKKFIEKNDIKWHQGYLGAKSKSKLPTQYGFKDKGVPAIFLIDPDGYVIAEGFHGTNIMSLLDKVLSDKQSKN